VLCWAIFQAFELSSLLLRQLWAVFFDPLLEYLGQLIIDYGRV
jgi:hypothetical protein